MAEPADFEGSNLLLLSPHPGETNISELPVFTNGLCCVSVWKLTQDEIAEVVRTGRIYVAVLSGRTQPPIKLGSEAVIRELIVDHGGGVWKKRET
jgi:hypothetical protein